MNPGPFPQMENEYQRFTCPGKALDAMETSTAGWTFMRRHKGALAIFVVAAALAFAWAVYVFWWFTGDAQSTGLVPSSLGLWSMGHLVGFIIYSVLWELVLAGIPVAVAALAAWVWWKRLPYEERTGYQWGKHSRKTGGSGGASILLFIAFAVKVYVDGNWNIPIATYTLNYVIGSLITILEWAAVIFGIPAAIALTLWVRWKLKKA